MSLVSGPGVAGGADQKADALGKLVVDAHVRYIQSLDTRKGELEYHYTEHLRLNGVYWGLTALHLLGHPDALPRADTIDFVMSCQKPDGGFGAAPRHDAHMLYTCSAVQVLATVDALDELERRGPGKQKLGEWIAGLQDKETGTFAGDEWGETDTRFLYCAFNALSLLGLLHLVDVEKAVQWIKRCENHADGGHGISPGSETHSAQVFTCVGALSIAGRLDMVNTRLAGWLSERQTESGGLNGRPEKLEDSCYSWWVASSLAMLGKLHWIDKEKLEGFILRCQDPEQGGLADRPGNVVDVYHTVFGVAGLSLLGYPGLVEVDPSYCMPKRVTDRVLGRNKA